MTAVWILLAIAAVLVVLNLLRVGVDAAYEAGVFTLKVIAGPVTITLLPKKPKKEKKTKKEKKEKQPAEPKPEPEDQPKEKKKFSLSFLTQLAKLALEAVNVFRRKLRVDVLRIVFVAGGKDPYDVAMRSGRVRAALDALYPYAARALTIREREVRVGADFLAEQSRVEGRLKLTIRIGQIVGIALVFAWKALMLLAKEKKQDKPPETPDEAAPASEAAEERNAEYGT